MDPSYFRTVGVIWASTTISQEDLTEILHEEDGHRLITVLQACMNNLESIAISLQFNEDSALEPQYLCVTKQ